MDIDIEELKRLAEEATPGPWIAAGPSFGADKPRYCDEVLVDREGDEDDTYTVAHMAIGLDGCPQTTADMEFIAAANPAAILKLITHLQHYMMAANAEAQYANELKAKVDALKADNAIQEKS